MEAKMKKETGNIYKTLLGTVLAVSVSLSGAAAVFADETSSSETTAQTEATTTTETSEETYESVDLSGKDITNIYGSQFYPYLNHKYVFNGEEVPITTSNFSFVNAFLDLCNYGYWGYYPLTGEGYYDLAAEYSGEKYKDYGDIFISYAEKSLANTLIMNKLAKEQGITLDLKTTEKLEESLQGLEKKAKAAGKTFEEYLAIYYGPEMTPDIFRKTMEMYYITDVYTQHFCDNYQFTDEEKKGPEIRYVLFEAPEQGSTDDVKKAAEKKANDLKNSADSLEKLKTLGDEAVAAKESLESNDIHVVKGQTVTAFEQWALDPARKEGDIDVIYAQEYGYFVVGFLGLTDQSEEVLESLAVEKLGDMINADIESGKYKLETKDTYAPAVTVAPTPTTAETEPSASGSSTAATSAGETTKATEKGSSSSSSFWTPTNVIVVILAAVGGVALIAAIIILVVQFIRNGSSKSKKKKKSNNSKKNNKPKTEKTAKEDKPVRKAVINKKEDEEESEDPEEE